MQFNSYLFLFLFLPLALAGYFGLLHFRQNKAAKLFLIAMSLVFYGFGNPRSVLLLIGSAALNWIVSSLLLKHRSKALLAFGIIANVGLLFYFKYFEFFLESLLALFHREAAFAQLVLPIGISFFTFQQIAWLVDSYREETKGYALVDYLLFTVYFPKITMGPILLHGEFIPQLKDETKEKLNAKNLSTGLMMLSVGLFKKVILAELFSTAVAWGFPNPGGLSCTEALLVMLAYTFQLYFDFSGYCDMAMGISQMFNLTLPLNFNSPYKATSITDFWNRWHITLTRFLRKYIYFPLGGNRKGTLRTYVNIIIVFLVSGLWHGANWTFILWGLIHGLAQVITRIFRRQWERLHPAFQWICTFGFVNLAWILFRADSMSHFKTFLVHIAQVGNQAIGPNFFPVFVKPEMPMWMLNHMDLTVFFIYAAALFLVMNPDNLGEGGKNLKPTFLRGLATAIMLVWSVLSLAGVSSFIYFQF